MAPGAGSFGAMAQLDELLDRATRLEPLTDDEVRRLASLGKEAPEALHTGAAAVRDDVFGPRITYSKKVFIPLTKLCRDSCGYCTFARPPSPSEKAYLSLDEVLAIASAGEAAGCKEALFTLGDKPERKWAQARAELASFGHNSTVSYLAAACRAVLEETSLLPHANPGAMTEEEIELLRGVSVSQGMMLETVSESLLHRGGAHFGAPDKKPAVRLQTLEAAGRARVPFTTGILIGIGESLEDRVEALLAIRAAH